MKNAFQITIPEPCHENWQEMTVVEKGRFCNSCQKTVIDFTKITDREIASYFNKNSNLCGRFNQTQLNRNIVVPKEKSTLWIAASTAIISFLTIGNNEVKAQGAPRFVQTDKKSSSENKTIISDDIEVSGKILSTSQEIFEFPVYIRIKETNQKFISNDGKFSIKLKKGKTVVFDSGYEEFEDKKIIFVESNDNYTVFLEKFDIKKAYQTVTLGGAIANGVKIETKKRTFFGRVFHKIGNWFR